jgi:hypothetical protein
MPPIKQPLGEVGSKKPPKDKHADDMAKVVASGLYKKPKYVTVANGLLTAVYCKKCGEIIQGQVDDPTHPPKRERRGNLIIETRVRTMAPLANYRRVVVHMEDGSTHETNCCASCAITLTGDDILAFLVIDMEELLQDGMRAGRPLKDDFVEMFQRRNAVEFEVLI